MDVREFDFALPAELIAQEPPRDRGGSRLLHLDRSTGSIRHLHVAALPGLLGAGDLVVVNDTRVFPARLIGRRVPSGGAVECLLIARLPPPPGNPLGVASASPGNPLGVASASSGNRLGVPSALPGNPLGIASAVPRIDQGSDTRPSASDHQRVSSPGSPELWEALVHPGQKLKPGARMVFDGIHPIHGQVLERHFFGRRVIRLWTEDGSTVDEAVDAIGHMPLPPYIKRDDRPADRDRYQTVFAQTRGSIAAPTAGLHFTPALLTALKARGIDVTSITLHVGYGTFQPVRVDRVEDHRVEGERYEIGPAAADALSRARAGGRRIIAVGTTTTRTLEHVVRAHPGAIVAERGVTDLFIYPGFDFRIVDGLLTNFHLPRSSLLMLVAAFAGRDLVRTAYDAAIAARYRFYSYGDAMLIT
jgi:S-adenosylmethionine:tRNA ribosyltransferase-isomerase